MLKGLNSDVVVKGRSYHVQTEDWGRANPFVVTRVFRDGAVIRTLKTPYSEILVGGPVSEVEALKLALRRQHSRVMDEILTIASPQFL